MFVCAQKRFIDSKKQTTDLVGVHLIPEDVVCRAEDGDVGRACQEEIEQKCENCFFDRRTVKVRQINLLRTWFKSFYNYE